jgi:ABC-type multidrug transport system fused ATPase/permease subunit
VVARLRVKLFTHLSGLEVGFYDVTRTGELINRLSTDTTVLKDGVTINVSMALRWASTVVVGIGYLFFISWKLTLVMLSVVPIVTVSAMVYGKKIKKVSGGQPPPHRRCTPSLSSLRSAPSLTALCAYVPSALLCATAQ